MLYPEKIKKDFPIFRHSPNLIYLDSTATSLKPQSVINKLTEYYAEYSANIFRGVYRISEKATEEYEKTREAVASFIHASESSEVIFTRNATESLNLVMSSWGRTHLHSGDEVVTTLMEHHSNFVTWQSLALEKGAVIKYIPVTPDGELNLREVTPTGTHTLEEYVTPKTKILALTYVSNVLGTQNPVKEIIAQAKRLNPHIKVVVDAAQAAPHIKMDVQSMGGDFLAFSAHKMLGPTGVGVLWGKRELLEEMEPYQFGGEMISDVGLEKTTFAVIPHKFEAGTPHIGGVIAFKEAIEYLQSLDLAQIYLHEKKLAQLTMQRLKERFQERIRIVGGTENPTRGGIVAFSFEPYHVHDIAQVLDSLGVAVRAGHHCAMPLHKSLGLSGTTRASFYIYNTEADVETFIQGLEKVEHIFKAQ